MNIKKVVTSAIVIIFLSLAVGIGVFVFNATYGYTVNKGFVSIPLQFNPYDSSSEYDIQNSKIKVYGGFVKGILTDKDGVENLVIRALSPLPSISIIGNAKSTGPAIQSIIIENINPDFYTKSIEGSNISMIKITANTLKFEVSINKEVKATLQPIQPSNKENIGEYKYIILGDNRDGYDTFEQIIQQINAEKPVFVIDNGDLVFSGKPNQYRLFDKIVSNIGTTLSTTLGNHDIRGNGRSTYTMLYGPPYYSFDFQNSHFIFLDSSPGWAEKKSISDKQYTWLEADLQNSQGKDIFVISHIPPVDPRSGITPNIIPNYVSQVKNGDSWIEQKLNNYSENMSMNHGFPDTQEAIKFENLMSNYHVDTVYLSHIHSYLEYTKDGVRYLISGGAGAELSTKNSYYHYMIAKIGDIKTTTMVELPSPGNNYLLRYSATIQLFANAMYKENPVSVVLIIFGSIVFLLLLIIRFYLWKQNKIDTIFKWIADIGKYAVKRFKELFDGANNK